MGRRHRVALSDEQQPLEQLIQERTRELSALLDISSRLASTLDLERLLPSLFEQFKTLIDFDSVALSFLEEDGHFALLEYRGPPPAPLQRLRWSLQEDDPPELHTILHQSLIIPDVFADTPLGERWRSGAQRIRGYTPDFLGCWMGVPLLANQRSIGLLSFEHRQPYYYTQHHAELAQALASHAAVSLENARLFRLEQRRSEQFRLIGEVSRQITRISGLEEVANQAAYHIQQAFGLSHVHIGLIEGDEVVFKEAAGVWREQRRCRYCSKHHYLVGKTGAAGHVAASGEALIVRDVQSDHRYRPMTERQQGSALILPLKTGDAMMGVLNIERDGVGGFDAIDIDVLQPLANQLAIALENARLYEQSRALAALQERQKLARELHDSVSQALYGIGLGARTATKLLESDKPDRQALSTALDYVLSLATAGLAEMRALIFELRPEILEAEGLVAALARHAEALRVRHGLDLDIHLVAEPDLPAAVKESLYRVAQEALQNIVKHAGASRAEIILGAGEETLTLAIRDNGRGFDPQGRFPGHLGLRSMRERMESVGGTFAVHSAPAEGTLIRVTIPLPAPTAHPGAGPPDNGAPQAAQSDGAADAEPPRHAQNSAQQANGHEQHAG